MPMSKRRLNLFVKIIVAAAFGLLAFAYMSLAEGNLVKFFLYYIVAFQALTVALLLKLHEEKLVKKVEESG